MSVVPPKFGGLSSALCQRRKTREVSYVVFPLYGGIRISVEVYLDCSVRFTAPRGLLICFGEDSHRPSSLWCLIKSYSFSSTLLVFSLIYYICFLGKCKRFVWKWVEIVIARGFSPWQSRSLRQYGRLFSGLLRHARSFAPRFPRKDGAGFLWLI